MTLIKLSLRFIIPLLAVIIAAEQSLSFPINGDIGWLYFVTENWLEGQELYSDILEVNPPMIFIIMSPAVLLSHFFELGTVAAIKIYLIIIGLLALFLNINMAKHLLSKSVFKDYYWVFIFLLYFVMPLNDFGQRDHLLILFIIPYFFLRFLSCNHKSDVSLWWQVLIGGTSGMVICLKPYFVLFPLACELFWFYKQGREIRFGVVNIAQLMTVGLFILFIILFQQAYIDNMIPLAIATYWTYGISLGSYDFSMYIFLFIVVCASTFICKDEGERQFIQYFCVMTVVALIIFLAQAKYPYHLLPFEVMLYITLFFSIMVTFKSWPDVARIRKYTEASYLYCFIGYFVFFMFNSSGLLCFLLLNKSLPTLDMMGYEFLDKSAKVINEGFSGESIYVLSSNVWPSAFISAYTKSKWSSGFPALWPLPAIDRYQRLPESITLEQQHNISKVKSFVTSKIKMEFHDESPVAIFVDTRNPLNYFLTDFNYVKYFESDEDLNEIFDGYIESDIQVEFFYGISYKVYIRRDYLISFK
ncbi:MAG: hypothetical protein V7771_17380 [Shewanella psychromarinicola]|uniref:hypothetical protein n=1 Tax=Shewanella psychromarinicola TaxID=2487742 RepID=UPI003001E1BB